MKEVVKGIDLLLRSPSTYAFSKYGKDAWFGTNEVKKAAVGNYLFSDNIQYCTAMMVAPEANPDFWAGHFEFLHNRDQAYRQIEKIVHDLGAKKFRGANFHFYMRNDPFGSKERMNVNTRFLVDHLEAFGVETRGIKIITGNSPVVVANGFSMQELKMTMAQRLAAVGGGMSRNG